MPLGFQILNFIKFEGENYFGIEGSPLLIFQEISKKLIILLEVKTSKSQKMSISTFINKSDEIFWIF